jgi:ubiquinone biosynthesis monooxygenase Coq7
MNLDTAIACADRALRTLFAPAVSNRTVPGDALPEAELTDTQRRHAVGLMRVNHTGEVCAQALYDGQMLVAREPRLRQMLERAGREETEHLAWTEQRLAALDGRKSLLNPLCYAGSFALGALAGLAGDRWSLGFLAETERQVEEHLDGHLVRLPAEDAKSRAVVEQMKLDEAGHAVTARRQGAAELPLPVRAAMRVAARVMTGSSRWL